MIETPAAVVRFPKGMTLRLRNRFAGVSVAAHRNDDLDVEVRSGYACIRAFLERPRSF